MIRRLVIILILVIIYPLIWQTNRKKRHGHIHQVQFRSMAELISLVPFQIGMLIRRLYYERTLAACGENIMVFFGSMFVNPDTRVGSQVEVRPYCMIGLADIGDHVSFSQRVTLLSGAHQHRARLDEVKQQRLPPQRIHIGSGVWIGANAVVMNDVGENAIVGAGAVVVKPIVPASVAVGVPAKVIERPNPLDS